MNEHFFVLLNVIVGVTVMTFFVSACSIWDKLSKDGSISKHSVLARLKRGFLIALVSVQTYLLFEEHLIPLLTMYIEPIKEWIS